ncbi:unnamed protein product [Amoebophrya sp. A120]|nr:unnamed protein product [Amoebophrya sp. A120]|eukprot:GSA120T00000535001.1
MSVSTKSARSAFTHEFPHWEDHPLDAFPNTRLNSLIEEWCWQEKVGSWVFNCNAKSKNGPETSTASTPKIRLDNDALLYICKYLFVRKLKICKRYPRNFAEFEDLRKKSYFFANADKCQPTPIVGSRSKHHLQFGQNLKYIAGQANDWVFFTGDYSQVVFFEDFKFEDNDVGDLGMCHLADFLVMSNVLVRNLRFFKNKVGELGAVAMAGYLQKAPVHEFHASHNFIPRLGCMALVVAAASNPHYPLCFPEYYKWQLQQGRGSSSRSSYQRYTNQTDHAWQTMREDGPQPRPLWMRLESNIIEGWTEMRTMEAERAFHQHCKFAHLLDPRAAICPEFLTELRAARSREDDLICEIRDKQNTSCTPRFCIGSCRRGYCDQKGASKDGVLKRGKVVDLGQGLGKINMMWYKMPKMHICYMNSSKMELENRKKIAPPIAKVPYEGQLYRHGFTFFMQHVYQRHNLPAPKTLQLALELPLDISRRYYPDLTHDGTSGAGSPRVLDLNVAAAAAAISSTTTPQTPAGTGSSQRRGQARRREQWCFGSDCRRTTA